MDKFTYKIFKKQLVDLTFLSDHCSFLLYIFVITLIGIPEIKTINTKGLYITYKH